MKNRQGVTPPIFRFLTLMFVLMVWTEASTPARQQAAPGSGGEQAGKQENPAAAVTDESAAHSAGAAIARIAGMAQQTGQPARSSALISPAVPVVPGSNLATLVNAMPALSAQPVASTPTSGSQAQTPASTSGGPATLSLQQAIDSSLSRNLTTLLAHERRREARGRELESFSGVLPNLSAAVYQASVTENLAALGFKPGLFPGLSSTFLGPFNNFDARLTLAQSIFDLSAIRRAQSGKTDLKISKMEEDLARQQVTSQTALSYLEALRSARAVEAALADLDLANSLYKLASDQHDAGVATGVDVTRAQTRVAQQQYRLADSQRAADQARLQLLRVTGLPLGSHPNLSDPLHFSPETMPPIEEAVQGAQQNRYEVLIAQQQVKLNDYDRRAAEAAQYPSLEFDANYGASGNTLDQNDLPTRTVMIRLNVPIFNGGVTRGRVEQAVSRFVQAQLTLDDTQAQVEQDVRLAQQTLSAAADEVKAADQAFTLAERQLQMARDRFAAGVADNIEVINAQTDLADARLAQVSALAQYTAARINMAYALGRISSFSL
ncbi:MAG TPA: TolC family protein [Blastocatellia bacterium]|nr:TolC family protein [Blastocatellia bacterium]